VHAADRVDRVKFVVVAALLWLVNLKPNLKLNKFTKFIQSPKNHVTNACDLVDLLFEIQNIFDLNFNQHHLGTIFFVFRFYVFFTNFSIYN